MESYVCVVRWCADANYADTALCSRSKSNNRSTGCIVSGGAQFDPTQSVICHGPPPSARGGAQGFRGPKKKVTERLSFGFLVLLFYEVFLTF